MPLTLNPEFVVSGTSKCLQDAQVFREYSTGLSEAVLPHLIWVFVLGRFFRLSNLLHWQKVEVKLDKIFIDVELLY